MRDGNTSIKNIVKSWILRNWSVFVRNETFLDWQGWDCCSCVIMLILFCYAENSQHHLSLNLTKKSAQNNIHKRFNLQHFLGQFFVVISTLDLILMSNDMVLWLSQDQSIFCWLLISPPVWYDLNCRKPLKLSYKQTIIKISNDQLSCSRVWIQPSNVQRYLLSRCCRLPVHI